jgi:hypothetical protein
MEYRPADVGEQQIILSDVHAPFLPLLYAMFSYVRAAAMPSKYWTYL